MEMVQSALVAEAVSAAVSFLFTGRGEKASPERLMERMEMAHTRLSLGLERTRRMPMTIIPLFCLKKKLKDAFEECDGLLDKARDLRQVVPSFPTKIMQAVLPSFVVPKPKQDVLSSSVVARFEWLAEEADKFVRDVESGSSLSHYRFLNPLIGQLLEGKNILYHKVQRSQSCSLGIWPVFVEEYGRVARLAFLYEDRMAPHKSFRLMLALRLYESTNIVGVAAQCLQSIGAQFKPMAKVGAGELTRLPTQDVMYCDSVDSLCWDEIVRMTTKWSPDPMCCIANGINKPCANNTISSELTGRFPQEVMFVLFKCCFSASDHCSRSSSNEAYINTIRAWPPLKLSVGFAPHISPNLPDESSLHQIEEGIRREAIDYFIQHPELTDYEMDWNSAHGWASFRVSKPITETRRGLKRRR
ncbi:hypothetical protein CFC21_064118 [Triticum aestivum]|uniref:Uncharacterized protein n=2 Tax=Triticum aestivum TaxID=4565 RepID=A0A3B6KC80_WHEAT|nr:uncharacterized protein LOC119296910 [Triticum dicoccoides]XP_044384554.1 uncharacterized protein LOC123106465 [Triticum aestivum]KAF7056739.1 hypothetical protein CFC21_064118 [Triticum aestivum]